MRLPGLLLLTRKAEETVVLEFPASDEPARVEITVRRVRQRKVDLAVIAPRAVIVFRGELEGTGHPPEDHHPIPVFDSPPTAADPALVNHEPGTRS